MTIRLRYAPSPTGFLHIGGARTALFNWAWARRMGGTFVLRVEDTDRARSKPEYERGILEALRWLGIDWDEGPDVGGEFGPYRQTERFERYRTAGEELLSTGHAYPCFCDAQRLAELRQSQEAAGETPAYDQRCRSIEPEEAARRRAAGEPWVLRFAVPEGGSSSLRDLVRGDVRVENSDVDDWIMVRADGSPTYNFCVVCDDAAMQITHVLRGVEHLTNTPKQLLVYAAMGLEPPAYAHLPLMLGKDKKKLSKRTGDTSVQDYSAAGYPPEAVANFLCLQGWSLDDRTTLLSLEDLVKHFDPADVSKGGAVFDPEKFLWMAGEYLRATDGPTLVERCTPFLLRAGLMTAEEIQERSAWLAAAVESERERMRLYADLPERLAYLFAPDDALPFDPKAERNARKQDPEGSTLLSYREWLEPRLVAGAAIDAAALREDTRAWVGEQGLSFGALFQPLRCALTGAAGGADLFDVMGLLGRERTLARLAAGSQRLSA